MVLQRRQQPVDQISQEELNALDPARLMTNAAGTYPSVWSEVGHVTDPRTAKLCKRVEIYPYSSDTEMYNYLGYTVPEEAPVTVLLATVLPPEVDEHVLRAGAIADAMRKRMSDALEGQPAQLDVAAHWRNEYRAQETVWERVIQDAARADTPSDDVTFILRRTAFTPSFDITTARDEVLARWPR